MSEEKDYQVARWTTPRIFSDDIYRRLEAGGDCGSGCGPGWLPLIEQLNEDLRLIDPDYTIGQIKEKFGTLRFYAYSNVGTGGTERFHKLIDQAEIESAVTCEMCGRPANRDSSTGWIKTLCWYHVWERKAREWWRAFTWDMKRGIQNALGLDYKWKRKKPRYKRDR